MDPFPAFFLFLGAVLLAVLVDALLVVGWRRRKEGQSFWDPRLVQWVANPPLVGRRLAPAIHRLGTFLAELRDGARALLAETRSNDLMAFRLALAVSALAVSVSLGVRDDILMTAGWELWLWAGSVGVALAALMPGGAWPIRLQRAHLWVLLPLAVALVLRLFHLGTIPHGLHSDEVATADFTMRYVFPEPRSSVYPFRTGPYSQPALFYYLVHLSLQLAGQNPFGLRLPSVLAGVAAVAATYALVNIWSNRKTALIAALLMAAYHYHIHWSRLALNNIWDTLWIPLVLACFAWGWRSRWRGGAVLCGLALGLSQYFYIGTRIAIILLAYVIYRVGREDLEARRWIVHIGTVAVMAAVVAAPLYVFASKHPGGFLERVRVNWAWTPDMIARFGSDMWAVLRMAGDQAWRSFAGFVSLPETTGFYGPGVPFLIGIAGPIFLAGILWALRRRIYLPVIWILTTAIVAGFLSKGTPASSHFIAAVPAVIWLMAIPLAAVAEWRHPRIAWALIALILAVDVYFYFGVYVPGGDHPHLTHDFPADPMP